MKKCPFCAEEIQDEAMKCRFCGEILAPGKETDKNLAQKIEDGSSCALDQAAEMKKFRANIINDDGNRHIEEFEALDENDAIKRLRAQNFIILSLKEITFIKESAGQAILREWWSKKTPKGKRNSLSFSFYYLSS